MFFANENNKQILNSFLHKADAAQINSEASKERLLLCRKIISSIFKDSKEWDSRCSFNIKYIGQSFLQLLDSFDSSDSDSIDYIYTQSYRFLCEFDFLIGSEKELGMDLRSLKEKIQNDDNDISNNLRSQIIYASFVMPANIVKEFINDSNIGHFKAFEYKKNEAERLKKEWDDEINKKRIEVENLKDKLDKYKIGFNFVGLYKGFSELATNKLNECFWLFWSLISMGILLLLPLLIETIFISFVLLDTKSLKVEHLFITLPLLSIEIILIYYFRIILVNYKSAKAQLMQIELRKTLCQFIQNYAEYSAKIKSDNDIVLEKFENIIFSGVISDPDKLPTTFDGLEQISTLIKSMKS